MIFFSVCAILSAKAGDITENTILTSGHAITHIHDVIESVMLPRRVDNTKTGRRCECFVYVKSGSCNYDFGNYTIDVSSGDVLYLAKNSRYKMDIKTVYEVIFVDFDTVLYENMLCSCSIPGALSDMREDFRKLYSVYSKETEHHLSSFSVLYKIYSELCDAVKARNSAKGIRKLTKLLSPAYVLMENNTNCSFSIPELSEKCGISEVHFRRSFEKLYGISPAKYINAQKTKRAKELLRSSAMPVFEIAEALGYSSIFYFSKSFKADVGMTPTEYRNMFFGT